MEDIAVENMDSVMDEPEQGCIVQADDPHMLTAAFDHGANAGSAHSGSTSSWYWTSMLKLMEQGAAPSNSSSHTPTNTAFSSPHFALGQQSAAHTPITTAAASSPSSSSVHDQPFDNNILVNSNANDPDSLVWSQDFLSSPISCESKPTNIHQLACSDDGLHELLYPRTVLELLFSDQLKLEQLPSWPDILQQTAGGAVSRSLSFPLNQDKHVTTPINDNIIAENQFDIRFPHYLNNYFQLGLDHDRLSSNTTSRTLSDNAIDQWVASNAAVKCESVQGPCMSTMHTAPLNSMQHIDYVHVKQEYPHTPSPPYTRNDINSKYSKLGNPYLHPNQKFVANSAGNVMDQSMLDTDFEQKPAVLMSRHWTSPVDPLNHRHHIYESITNARLGGLDAVNCFQHVNNHGGGTATIDHLRIGHGTGVATAVPLQYINQQASEQLGKKSRPLEGAGTGQVDETEKENTLLIREGGGAAAAASDSSLASKAKGAVHNIIPASSAPSTSPCKHGHQLSATEYNFKRSRNPPPPTSSSSSFKSQPVRKEKLGERITTLQQLVSPFGKTDTASVLLEAIGYIKFLQEQVQALSSPYFKGPTTQSGDDAKPDLRSRGLCLVPLSCTMQVANDNGADYWYGGAFR